MGFGTTPGPVDFYELKSAWVFHLVRIFAREFFVVPREVCIEQGDAFERFVASRAMAGGVPSLSPGFAACAVFCVVFWVGCHVMAFLTHTVAGFNAFSCVPRVFVGVWGFKGLEWRLGDLPLLE